MDKSGCELRYRSSHHGSPESLEEQLKRRQGSSHVLQDSLWELLEDGGGVIDKGLDKKGFGRSVKGRLVGVHRMLASGTAVTKGNAVLLDGIKGWIIPKSGKIRSWNETSLQGPGEAVPQRAETT